MEPIRLDPADPLASVLRWLAALAQALGLDPAVFASRIRLTHASARIVRGWLAEWSRQLRAIVRAKAALLALTLRISPAGAPRGRGRSSFPSPLVGEGTGMRGAGGSRQEDSLVGGSAAGPSPHPRPLSHKGERGAPFSREPRAVAALLAVAHPGRRDPRLPRATSSAIKPAPHELLSVEEQAALRRRTRAVLAGLRDPSAAIARLARRLARLGATEAPRRHRPRAPLPPRTLGAVLFGFAPAPEPRPPDRWTSAVRPAMRPEAPAAAAPALR